MTSFHVQQFPGLFAFCGWHPLDYMMKRNDLRAVIAAIIETRE